MRWSLRVGHSNMDKAIEEEFYLNSLMGSRTVLKPLKVLKWVNYPPRVTPNPHRIFKLMDQRCIPIYHPCQATQT